MKKNAEAKKAPSLALASLSLLINLSLVGAGIGTLVGGKPFSGLVQFTIVFLSGLLAFYSVGVLVFMSAELGTAISLVATAILFAAWLWSIVSSVYLIRDALRATS